MSVHGIPQLDLGEVVGVMTASGPNFYKMTESILDGPFLDRECTERPPDPAMPRIRKDRASGMIERHHGTGKRRRNKAITMSDMTEYRTDGNGVIHRLTPKTSKKDRETSKRIAGEINGKTHSGQA